MRHEMNDKPDDLNIRAAEVSFVGERVAVSLSEALAIIRTWSPEERQEFKAEIEAASDSAGVEKAVQNKPDLWQVFRTVPWRHLVVTLSFLIAIAGLTEQSIGLAHTLAEAPTAQPNVTININVNNCPVIDFSTSPDPPPYKPEH